MAKQQDREKVLSRRLKTMMRILGRWDSGIEEPRLAEQCGQFFARDLAWLIERGLVDRAAPERSHTGRIVTPARVWPSMRWKRAVADGA